jgi:hypothetical protein
MKDAVAELHELLELLSGGKPSGWDFRVSMSFYQTDQVVSVFGACPYVSSMTRPAHVTAVHFFTAPDCIPL